MRLPNFLTEEEFLAAFDSVIVKLVKKFTFNIYDVDDIRQEAFLIASEGVFNFNPAYNVPLESFLYTHLYNRLINFKRDNYLRRENNCQECRNISKVCARCEQRERLNMTKKSILEPANIESLAHPTFINEYEKKVDQETIISEILRRLTPLQVQDFYKIRDGVRINNNKKKRIIEIIQEIMTELDYAP